MCLLFAVRRLLSVVCYLVFAARCLLFGVWCLLSVALFAVALSAVCRLLFVVC